MATPPVTETLTIMETERHLQEALTLVKYDPDTRTTSTFPVDNLEEAASLTDLKSTAFQHIRQPVQPQQALVPLLSSRQSWNTPSLVALMQTDRLDRRKAAPKISQLLGNTGTFHENGRRVRDYMDWYEINTRTGSGKTFDSYAATMKLIREQEAPANTPIARYLDDIEKLYTLPAKAPVPPLYGND